MSGRQWTAGGLRQVSERRSTGFDQSRRRTQLPTAPVLDAWCSSRPADSEKGWCAEPLGSVGCRAGSTGSNQQLQPTSQLTIGQGC